MTVHAAETATSLNRLALGIKLNKTIIDEISNYSFLIWAKSAKGVIPD